MSAIQISLVKLGIGQDFSFKQTKEMPIPQKNDCLDFVKVKKYFFRTSCLGSVEMNLTSIHEDTSLIPGPFSGVKDPALL